MVFVLGGVLRAGGDAALQSEGCSDLPAAGGRVQQPHCQQHASNHGPQTEGGLPQEPGGVCCQCWRASVCQINHFLQQLSTAASPLYPLYHSEKPFTMPNHGDAQCSTGWDASLLCLWAFRHACLQRGERPAKAGRGRPVGHDHLSLIWLLFTLPLRGPQMNIYEVWRGNLSENWSLHPPFTLTHTVFCRRFFLSAFVFGFSRLGSSCVHGDNRTVPYCTHGTQDCKLWLPWQKPFPMKLWLQEGPLENQITFVFKGVYIYFWKRQKMKVFKRTEKFL